jgi:hypothetical protein
LVGVALEAQQMWVVMVALRLLGVFFPLLAAAAVVVAAVPTEMVSQARAVAGRLVLGILTNVVVAVEAWVASLL